VVESMMVKLVKETREILVRHLPLLRSLSQELTAEGIINAPRMLEVATKYGMEVAVREEGFLNVDDYYDLLHNGENK